MPELIALKLLVLVRRVLQTSPRMKIQIEKKDTQIGIINEDRSKSGAKTVGFYSKHVLWNKPALTASIDDISKRFKNLNV